MSILPDKPSALLALALKDLASCEHNPLHYIVNMGVWVIQDPEYPSDPCIVCLAGAVMVQSLSITKTVVHPNDLHALCEADRRKLMALDALRIGEIDDALRQLHLPRPLACPPCVYVPEYIDGATAWRVAMDDLHTLLLEHNL